MIYAKLKTASEKREEAGGSSFTFRKWIAFRHIGTDEWNGRMAQLVEPPGTFGQNSDVQVNEPLASRSHRKPGCLP